MNAARNFIPIRPRWSIAGTSIPEPVRRYVESLEKRVEQLETAMAQLIKRIEQLENRLNQNSQKSTSG
jgi:chaperonin cofactor prefoldin